MVNLQSRGINFSTINLILVEEELNDSDDEYDEEGRQYVEKLQKKSVSLIRECLGQKKILENVYQTFIKRKLIRKRILFGSSIRLHC